MRLSEAGSPKRENSNRMGLPVSSVCSRAYELNASRKTDFVHGVDGSQLETVLPRKIDTENLTANYPCEQVHFERVESHQLGG